MPFSSVKNLIIVIILLIYILSAHIIEVKKFRYLHESAIAILMGLGVAIVLELTMDQHIIFDKDFFFNFILPPIIFAAGFNLRIKNFFENFGYIMFFGIIGTIITFFVISCFGYIFNEFSFIVYNKFLVSEILLLGCVLSATDTVAALSLVKEQHFPKLNSILFGEGIVNDAVSILIFRLVNNSVNSGSFELNYLTILTICAQFVYLLSVSLLIGVLFGLAITYIFKKYDSFRNYPLRETSMMILTAYMSYLVSEMLHLSGIISLFCCGIIMAYYTYHNISEEAQKGTVMAFDSVGYLCEAFVFAYLGMTVFGITSDEFYPVFIILMILALAFARFLSVFMLPCLFYLLMKNSKLQIKELKVIWYSGLIRGAIAFALCFNVESKNKVGILTTTLAVVLGTTFVLSILLQSFSEYVGLRPATSEDHYGEYQKYILNKRESEELSGYTEIGTFNKIMEEKRVSEALSNEDEKLKKQREFIERKELERLNFVQKTWRKFDEKVMKPIFVDKNKEIEYSLSGRSSEVNKPSITKSISLTEMQNVKKN